MPVTRFASFALISATLCAAACSANETRRTTITAATRSTPGVERAVMTIAGARCAQRERCAARGGEWQFPEKELCMDVMLNDGYAELDRCVTDVRDDEISGCLADIEALGCDEPLAGLSSLEDCSAEDLCIESE